MRRLVAVTVSVGAGMLASGLAAGNNGTPDRYRFTGWMTANGSPGAWPRHLVVEGDAGTLRFADRWNLTRQPVAYRVCVFKVGSSRMLCMRGQAPIDTRPSVLPVFVGCCGDFIAKWYVGGRIGATWPFRYVPENG